MVTAMRNGADQAIVVGGGPAGLASAVLLARAGVPTTIVRKDLRPGQASTRTTALLGASVELLRDIGAWSRIAPVAAPLTAMRLIDDTGGLFRAPTVLFRASELDREAFGFNVPNDALTAALEEVATATKGLTVIDGLAGPVEWVGDGVAVTVGNERHSASLVVAADGRDSRLRNAAGIETVRWRYEQTALTVNLEHTAPHDGVSTEFHTPSGPFTLVPLPGNRSSLVAVLRPRDAARLAALPDPDLAAELERRAHSLLGRFTIASARGTWPLEGLTPRRFAARRVALVGEAAHVLPPIGAQGLNLGLRDAAAIADIAGTARRNGADIGAEPVLATYDAARRTDVWSRTYAIDALNRTLLSPFLPAHAVRGLGLWLAEAVPPLRRRLLKVGLGAG